MSVLASVRLEPRVFRFCVSPGHTFVGHHGKPPGELGLHDIRPEWTRRNVFTRGLDLAAMIGVEFEIQGIRSVGTEECRPCYWKNRAFAHHRVEAWLNERVGCVPASSRTAC